MTCGDGALAWSEDVKLKTKSNRQPLVARTERIEWLSHWLRWMGKGGASPQQNVSPATQAVFRSTVELEGKAPVGAPVRDAPET